MQFIADAQKRALMFLEENTSTLLTAGGVVGTVGTAVLAGRAGYKFSQLVETETHVRTMEQVDPDISYEAARRNLTPLTNMEKASLAWPYFVPPVITGGVTIGCTIMANRMSAQKAAALAAAYGLSQKHHEEYRDKVAEKLGLAKHEKLKDELAQDQVTKNPPPTVIIAGDGEVLCLDNWTGRYFRCSVEKIKRAQNKLNEDMINATTYASMGDFYEAIGLNKSELSDHFGWNTANLIDLQISTTMTEDERPCVVISHNNAPKHDYDKVY